MKKRSSRMKSRRYLNMDIEDFFVFLNKENIRYVVLRWFETLPVVEGDIDLLVHDEDLDKISHLFSSEYNPSLIAFDIYSVSGLKGSDYYKLPYYPPHISESILRERMLYKNKYYVPNHQHHFFSLAYHIVYHKAESSGLPIKEGTPPLQKKPKRNYANILTKLSKQVGIPLEDVSLDRLHRLLMENDWCPGMETIGKLAVRKKALVELYNNSHAVNIENGDLITFIIREWAVKKNLVKYIIEWLDYYGFCILDVNEIDDGRKELATKRLRGGNWDKGKYAVNGGIPSMLVVAYDLHPTPVPRYRRKKYPLVSNGRLFLKKRLRERLNRKLPKNQTANMIHSSDNPMEAMEFLTVICPERIPEILKKITTITSKYKTTEKVLKTFKGNNHRGKIELVEKNNKKVVKKTFKPGKERYLEREKFAYETLSQKSPLIPAVIESGENYTILPYYQDLLSMNIAKQKEIILNNRKEIKEFLIFMYNEGYAHIDFLPKNLVYSKEEGLKVIDFEYLYRYRNKPKTFSQSYDLIGTPKDFDGELPPQSIHIRGYDSYKEKWKSACGYCLIELINLEDS